MSLDKFSDNVTCFAWRLVTLGGVNAEATWGLPRGSVITREINISYTQTKATTSHSPRSLSHHVTFLPHSEPDKVSGKNGISRK